MFTTYTMDPEAMIDKQRPIYLGVLIYDYAKKYMYDNMISILGYKLDYMDTDAGKFRKKYLNDWLNAIGNKIVPHWPEVEEYDDRYKTHKIFEPNSKVFGSYENEIEFKSTMFYAVEKKSWLCCNDNEYKMKFKGINENAVMLNGDEEFVEKYTKRIMKHDVESMRFKTIQNEQNDDIIERNMIEMNMKAWDYFEKCGENRLSKKYAEFFEKIYNEESVYVLTNNMRRIVKNSNRNVDMDDEGRFNNNCNGIQMNYLIKKINIKESAEKKLYQSK